MLSHHNKHNKIPVQPLCAESFRVEVTTSYGNSIFIAVERDTSWSKLDIVDDRYIGRSIVCACISSFISRLFGYRFNQSSSSLVKSPYVTSLALNHI